MSHYGQRAALKRERVRWLATVPGVVVVALVSACAGPAANYEPVAAEPEHGSLEVVQVVMPADLLAVFPDGNAFSVSRFVSRTLETAPDGQSRRWPTNDPAVTLVIRPDSTQFVGDTVCRRATIIVESRAGDQRFGYRACRTATGMWIP